MRRASRCASKVSVVTDSTGPMVKSLRLRRLASLVKEASSPTSGASQFSWANRMDCAEAKRGKERNEKRK